MNILDISWISFTIYAAGAGLAGMIILDRILGDEK